MPANYWQAENEPIGGGQSAHASYSRQGNTCVRTARVPWGEYPDIVLAILGYTTASGDPLQLTRFLPYRDPINKGMYAQSVSVRGVSPDGFTEWVPDQATPTPHWPLRTHERYIWAELTITFATIHHRLAPNLGDQVASVNQISGQVQGKDPPDGGAIMPGFIEQQRYCLKYVREGREYVTALPGVFIRSTSQSSDFRPPIADVGRLTLQFPIPAVLSFADISVTWLDVPLEAVPIQAIARAMGKVNDEVLELPQFPPPRYVGPETLLLQSFAIEDIFFPDQYSTRACNITYHFRWRGGHSSDIAEALFGANNPNWNKVPIPFLDGNKNVVTQFTRVLRKPIGPDYPLNAKQRPMGIFDVFRFDYLFRPARPVPDALP